MVQPITRDPELKNPRTNSRQVSWLTDQHIKSRLPGFPVTAHPRMTSHSLFTVTRSYRTCTCFPFNLRSYKTPSAPVVYYSISYRITLFFQLYNTSGYFFINKSHRGSRYKNKTKKIEWSVVIHIKSINNISYMRCIPCLLPDWCLPDADCAFHCRKRCCDIYFR